MGNILSKGGIKKLTTLTEREDLLESIPHGEWYAFVHPEYGEEESVALKVGKWILVLALLLPARIVFMVTCIPVWYVAMRLFMLFQPLDEPTRVEGRHFLFARFTQWGCRIVLFFLGFYWIPVEGEELPETTTLVANHMSWIDIAVVLAIRPVSFVAKEEVASTPMVSWVAQALRCVLVKRREMAPAGSETPLNAGSGAKAIRTRQEALEAAVREQRPGDCLSEVMPLLVFPEGTTTNGRAVMPFKRGAFGTHTQVQPVALRYSYRYRSPSWDAIPFHWQLFNMLTQVANYVSVSFLPPVRGVSAEVRAREAQRAIATKLNIPCTKATQAQKMQLHHACIDGMYDWRLVDRQLFGDVRSRLAGNIH